LLLFHVGREALTGRGNAELVRGFVERAKCTYR
jgi:hypothetical protein